MAGHPGGRYGQRGTPAILLGWARATMFRPMISRSTGRTARRSHSGPSTGAAATHAAGGHPRRLRCSCGHRRGRPAAARPRPGAGGYRDAAPVDGRMCPVTLSSGALLICDEKNSSEESVRSGLDALASMPGTRKIVVMGEIFEPQGKTGPLYRSIGEQIGRVAACALLLVGRTVYSGSVALSGGR